MTLAARVRAHPAWPDYLKARDELLPQAARQLSLVIAMDLELTERQRVDNLPRIAKQTKARGRPRRPPIRVRCPKCDARLVYEP